jgi:ribosomal protein S26
MVTGLTECLTQQMIKPPYYCDLVIEVNSIEEKNNQKMDIQLTLILLCVQFIIKCSILQTVLYVRRNNIRKKQEAWEQNQQKKTEANYQSFCRAKSSISSDAKIKTVEIFVV